MQCPYCNYEMEKGIINQEKYTLKWKSEKNKKKKIKLTSFMEKTYVEAYLCNNCNKLIIDI